MKNCKKWFYKKRLLIMRKQILPEHKEHHGAVAVEQHEVHAIPGTRQVRPAPQ